MQKQPNTNGDVKNVQQGSLTINHYLIIREKFISIEPGLIYGLKSCEWLTGIKVSYIVR
jgi:hypothetical protein